MSLGIGPNHTHSFSESIVVQAPSRGIHHADSSLLAPGAKGPVKPHIMGKDAQGRDSCIRAEEAVMFSYALIAQSSRLEAARWLEVPLKRLRVGTTSGNDERGARGRRRASQYRAVN